MLERVAVEFQRLTGCHRGVLRVGASRVERDIGGPGRIADQTGVRHFRAEELDLDVPADTGYNVDGEILSRGGARFTVEHEAYRLIVG